MAKMYVGNVPSEKDGWVSAGGCSCSDGSEWLFFKKAQNHSDDWVTFKVVAKNRALAKANYWLVMSTNSGKIGFARDYAIMRKERPELHTKVESVIASYEKSSTGGL